MGRLTKKIAKAQHAKAEAKPIEQTDKTLTKKEKRQQLWLLAFTLFSVLILAFEHQVMDAVTTGLYVLLIISLVSTYLRGTKRFAGTIEQYLIYSAMGSMILAIFLFVYMLYDRFIAN